MKIVACVKFVQDPRDIVVGNDGTLDCSRAQIVISDYDLQVLEEGARLAAEHDAEFEALTFGGPAIDDSASRKAVLSRGPQSLTMILADDADSYDTYDIAQVLSSAIKRSGADVVLFGEGSSDRYFRQVGAVTGTLLGWPTANCVSGISIESDVAKVERTLDSVVTQLEAPLPVALTLTADINVPRMPGMRDIIQSGKKPFTILSPGDLGVCKAEATETIEELAPSEPERKQLVIEGTPEEMVSQLIGHLKRDAAL